MIEPDFAYLGSLLGRVLAFVIFLVPFVCLIVIFRRTGHSSRWTIIASIPLLFGIGGMVGALSGLFADFVTSSLWVFAVLIWIALFTFLSAKAWPNGQGSEEVFR